MFVLARFFFLCAKVFNFQAVRQFLLFVWLLRRHLLPSFILRMLCRRLLCLLPLAKSEKLKQFRNVLIRVKHHDVAMSRIFHPPRSKGRLRHAVELLSQLKGNDLIFLSMDMKDRTLRQTNPQLVPGCSESFSHCCRDPTYESDNRT